MRSPRDRERDELSLEDDLFRLNGFESYQKFKREKMIDICCFRSGVKYNSLSSLSNVITSPVEFSTGKFRAKTVWKVFFNMALPISKKNKGHFRKSIEKKKEKNAFEGCVRPFCIRSNCAI